MKKSKNLKILIEHHGSIAFKFEESISFERKTEIIDELNEFNKKICDEYKERENFVFKYSLTNQCVVITFIFKKGLYSEEVLNKLKDFLTSYNEILPN